MDAALKPLFEYPDDPHIVKAADQMFDQEGSPWNPLLNLESAQAQNVQTVFGHKGLTKLEPFRRQVSRVLRDTRRVGTVTIVDEDSIRIEIPYVRTSGIGRSKWRGKLPRVGTAFALRVCDMQAYLLSPYDEFPECELFWSEELRDKAIAVCLDCLASADE